jgi:hypothetical protein
LGKADNEGMDAEQAQKYRDFAKGAWENAVNHKEGEVIPDEEFLLSVDKDGYRHTVTTQRIRHIYKQHGNEKAEKARGQIAITESDIELIPDIIENFTYSIRNFTYNGKKAVIYAKQGNKNTYIYIERISNKWHRKTTVTFFNLGYTRDAESVLRMLKNSNGDVSKAEIIGVGGGGNPTSTAQTESRRTVANSVFPPDTSLSPDSAEKSMGRK